MGLIYTLSHPETNEIRYIGKTERSLPERKREHRFLAKREGTHLYCWWRSLPIEPVAAVLQEVANRDLGAAEKYWIAYFRQLGTRLVNHTDGGEGQSGFKHSEKTKAKISAANKGKPHPWVNPSKAWMANKGKKLVGIHLEQVLAGQKKAIEASKSDEARIARSRALGGLPVFCIETETQYDVPEAARNLKLDASSIHKAAKGQRLKSTGGFTFKYVNPSLNLTSR